MDGRPVIDTQQFMTSQGPGALVAETKEHLQLLRWRFGKPSVSDEQEAKEWRQTLSTIDLEKTRARLKLLFAEIPKVRTFTELGSSVDALCQLGDQKILLEACLEDARIAEPLREEIRARWAIIQNPILAIFAPYAFFCFRIRMLFHLGLVNNLISTRSSNTADLIYLYYVPFSVVFSSNDKLHEDLAPLVLRPDQYFIRTSSLRSDFEAIGYFQEFLSDQQKRMWHERFGSWPPRNTGSFTYRVWMEKMRLPGELRRGNNLKKMSTAARAKVDRQVKDIMAQFREIQEQLKMRDQSEA